jgi:SWIM zinc finger
MTQAELEKREERARSETFVIKKTDEGYRIYAPGNPTRNYLVAGPFDAPTCTCPDFEGNRADPEWRCKHILAIENHVGGRDSDEPAANGALAHEERRPVRQEGRLGETAQSQMLLKRSVSPDGRIDSLSVEFACPVEAAAGPAVKRQARQVLELQSEIVEDFLAKSGGNGRGTDNGDDATAHTIEARLLSVCGMETRYGRRLYINVRVNGDILKLFGSRKQLAEAIEAAGFPSLAERVEEGVRLDIPCLVTTKPTEDGRYENVDRVLPLAYRRGQSRER